MKSLLAVLVVLSVTHFARATPAQDLLAPAIAGQGTVYFRVAFEKKNGIDMRENAMPKDIIQAIEKEGGSVRPNRTDSNVSYWLFFKNGDFATCDVVNDAAHAQLSYKKLGEFFADAPRQGPKWSVSGEDLTIGRRYYSVRVLTADDPATGGRKGEAEIAVTDDRGKVYYYFGSFIQPPA